MPHRILFSHCSNQLSIALAGQPAANGSTAHLPENTFYRLNKSLIVCSHI
jgi:hypothetical protein